MKVKNTWLFVGISWLSLLIVLVIQINWMLQSAKMKQELFNEKARMVLTKTAEALEAGDATFRNMELQTDTSEIPKVDSLFAYYMKVYNIQIDYYFELKPEAGNQKSTFTAANYIYSDKQGSFEACLGGDTEMKGMILKLVFPDQEQYIKAEMGTPFISSVLLILLVLFISWRNIVSLIREQKIAKHTTDFLNNMTHEFKTPITNIALAGKMMVKDVNIGDEEKIKHYSEIILEENQKLQHQVEQVLNIAALESGEILLNKTKIDLHEVIRNAVKSLGIQLDDKQVRVTTHLNAAKHFLSADQLHLTNAICNIIDNAIKYSNATPEINIETLNSGNEITLRIHDNGIGIEKKYHDKVFEKYFRVPTGDVHNVKGFGIGLSHIKKIIELHEGKIFIESTPNAGTTFTITLPNAEQ